MVELTHQEVEKHIEWLSSFSDGETPGVTRLLYSPSWVEAQKKLKEEFEELGAKVEFDEIGNLFATIEGTEKPESIIASGSHVDTVVEGGSFDGQLGVLSAYMVVKKLLEEKGKPKKTLQIISMAEEEGSRFPYAFWGSKNIFGIADKEDVIKVKDPTGVKFVDAMHNAGFDFLEGNPQFNNIDAFVELHIEQGNYLENNNVQVGIVDAIVGQKRYTVKLKGQANHAGTTMMNYRKDTVECYARIVTQHIEKAKLIGNPLVLTFGHVSVSPNTVNVVAGETEFSIDCRHTDQKVLDKFTDEMEENMRNIAIDMGIEIEIDNWMNESPVLMSSEIVDTIEEVCEHDSLNYQVMHSGAGHDSQIFAQYVPTAMIFVPSVNGVSHNPEEFTKTEDIIPGIQALAGTMEKLAY